MLHQEFGDVFLVSCDFDTPILFCLEKVARLENWNPAREHVTISIRAHGFNFQLVSLLQYSKSNLYRIMSYKPIACKEQREIYEMRLEGYCYRKVCCRLVAKRFLHLHCLITFCGSLFLDVLNIVTHTHTYTD